MALRRKEKKGIEGEDKHKRKEHDGFISFLSLRLTLFLSLWCLYLDAGYGEQFLTSLHDTPEKKGVLSLRPFPWSTMPYSVPAPVPSPLPVHSQGRPGHRRSYSSVDHGPGAFAPLAALPTRRRPLAPPPSPSSHKFHFRNDQDDDDDSPDDTPDAPPPTLKLNPNSSFLNPNGMFFCKLRGCVLTVFDRHLSIEIGRRRRRRSPESAFIAQRLAPGSQLEYVGERGYQPRHLLLSSIYPALPLPSSTASPRTHLTVCTSSGS